MLPELVAYSTVPQSPSSSHTQLWRGKSSFQKQGTWCHEVLISTMCANTSLPEKIIWDGAIQAVLVLTLYQKFTVMVIPPFRRDSMWCHLHGNHIKKRKETIAVAYSEIPWMMSSDSTRQAWPYTSFIKTSKLLESSPYLNIDPFLTC